MQTPISEVFGFLEYTINKGFLNNHTAGSRKTACKNLLEVLDEGQKTVEFARENLDSIVKRFDNKYKNKFTGNTIEVYKSRVKNTLDDFVKWREDKSAWERDVGKTKISPSKSQEKETSKAKEKNARVDEAHRQEGAESVKPTRRLSFPIRPDFEVKVEIPHEGLTTAELRRLGIFLFPYCSDFTPEKAAEWGLIAKGVQA